MRKGRYEKSVIGGALQQERYVADAAIASIRTASNLCVRIRSWSAFVRRASVRACARIFEWSAPQQSTGRQQRALKGGPAGRPPCSRRRQSARRRRPNARWSLIVHTGRSHPRRLRLHFQYPPGLEQLLKLEATKQSILQVLWPSLEIRMIYQITQIFEATQDLENFYLKSKISVSVPPEFFSGDCVELLVVNLEV